MFPRKIQHQGLVVPLLISKGRHRLENFELGETAASSNLVHWHRRRVKHLRLHAEGQDSRAVELLSRHLVLLSLDKFTEVEGQIQQDLSSDQVRSLHNFKRSGLCRLRRQKRSRRRLQRRRGRIVVTSLSLHEVGTVAISVTT
jgi:hypothetical protein